MCQRVYGLDLVDGYGSVKEDLSPMGASIRPSLTVIDIRLKFRRAVREMNRDIQIVISSPKIVVSGPEPQLQLADRASCAQNRGALRMEQARRLRRLPVNCLSCPKPASDDNHPFNYPVLPAAIHQVHGPFRPRYRMRLKYRSRVRGSKETQIKRC
jgi:hypothetical protein